MNSLVSLISFNSIIFITAIFFLIISPSYCSNHKHRPDTFMVLLVDEKARMGSMPPSCHNKCNNCHPCTAAEEPTLPGNHRVDPSSFQETPAGKMYSNYKPLGWKCRCGGHFYNP
ncbi:hypothetical protein ABFS83_12G012900 [Erythranthe nasuta]